MFFESAHFCFTFRFAKKVGVLKRPFLPAFIHQRTDDRRPKQRPKKQWCAWWVSDRSVVYRLSVCLLRLMNCHIGFQKRNKQKREKEGSFILSFHAYLEYMFGHSFSFLLIFIYFSAGTDFRRKLLFRGVCGNVAKPNGL